MRGAGSWTGVSYPGRSWNICFWHEKLGQTRFSLNVHAWVWCHNLCLKEMLKSPGPGGVEIWVIEFFNKSE